MKRILENEIGTVLDGFDVYPQASPPAKRKSPPYVLYSIIGDDPNDMLKPNISPIRRESWQIDYYAATAIEARRGADEIEELLLAWENVIVYSSNTRSSYADELFGFSREYSLTYDKDDGVNPP